MPRPSGHRQEITKLLADLRALRKSCRAPQRLAKAKIERRCAGAPINPDLPPLLRAHPALATLVNRPLYFFC